MLTSELLLLFNNAGQHIGNMVFHWHYRRLLEPMIELFPKTLSLVQFTDYDEAMDSTVGGTCHMARSAACPLLPSQKLIVCTTQLY
jgi:hypothetical protein